jgi:hypothetical protein
VIEPDRQKQIHLGRQSASTAQATTTRRGLPEPETHPTQPTPTSDPQQPEPDQTLIPQQPTRPVSHTRRRTGPKPKSQTQCPGQSLANLWPRRTVYSTLSLSTERHIPACASRRKA